jgi:hypothetical protein
MTGRATPSFVREPDETPGAEPCRLALPLLLDERKIMGHIVESLSNRREGNLIVRSEFFRAAGIRPMDSFVNYCPGSVDP